MFGKAIGGFFEVIANNMEMILRLLGKSALDI